LGLGLKNPTQILLFCLSSAGGKRIPFPFPFPDVNDLVKFQPGLSPVQQLDVFYAVKYFMNDVTLFGHLMMTRQTPYQPQTGVDHTVRMFIHRNKVDAKVLMKELNEKGDRFNHGGAAYDGIKVGVAALTEKFRVEKKNKADFKVASEFSERLMKIIDQQKDTFVDKHKVFNRSDLRDNVNYLFDLVHSGSNTEYHFWCEEQARRFNSLKATEHEITDSRSLICYMTLEVGDLFRAFSHVKNPRHTGNTFRDLTCIPRSLLEYYIAGKPSLKRYMDATTHHDDDQDAKKACGKDSRCEEAPDKSSGASSKAAPDTSFGASFTPEDLAKFSGASSAAKAASDTSSGGFFTTRDITKFFGASSAAKAEPRPLPPPSKDATITRIEKTISEERGKDISDGEAEEPSTEETSTKEDSGLSGKLNPVSNMAGMRKGVDPSDGEEEDGDDEHLEEDHELEEALKVSCRSSKKTTEPKARAPTSRKAKPPVDKKKQQATMFKRSQDRAEVYFNLMKTAKETMSAEELVEFLNDNAVDFQVGLKHMNAPEKMKYRKDCFKVLFHKFGVKLRQVVNDLENTDWAGVPPRCDLDSMLDTAKK